MKGSRGNSMEDNYTFHVECPGGQIHIHVRRIHLQDKPETQMTITNVTRKLLKGQTRHLEGRYTYHEELTLRNDQRPGGQIGHEELTQDRPEIWRTDTGTDVSRNSIKGQTGPWRTNTHVTRNSLKGQTSDLEDSYTCHEELKGQTRDLEDSYTCHEELKGQTRDLKDRYTCHKRPPLEVRYVARKSTGGQICNMVLI